MNCLAFVSITGVKIDPRQQIDLAGIQISRGDEFAQFLRNDKNYLENIGRIHIDLIARRNVAVFDQERLNDLQFLNGVSDIRVIGIRLLAQITEFFHGLWLDRDNNINAEDIFVHDLDSNLFTYFSTKSQILNCKVSTSDVSILDFNEVVIVDYIKFRAVLHKNHGNPIKDWLNLIDEKKDLLKLPFSPYSKSRLYLAIKFLDLSRSQFDIFMRISILIVMFECIFTTDNSEVSHKVSERIAYFIGENKTDRIRVFDLVKLGYDVRSKVFHGGTPKYGEDQVYSLSDRLDNLARQIMRKLIIEQENFKSQDSITTYFKDLIFS
ncbi:hypothetical protein GVN16_09890 [Emticicia sp. CRIBPO]|uniref:HEPN domain-containing protein n=1 Tax=Emticicia sp. CRIBPO TaxID=2683258 RepID=UPI001412442C|nr:HEPN domain-containing protein [Emticicia sp. CRIBPO]NBA86073.1 hypothetical protein [Emticicia sp. CRIBPO]